MRILRILFPQIVDKVFKGSYSKCMFSPDSFTANTEITIPNPMNYPAIGHLDVACYFLGACMILAMAKIIIPGNLPENDDPMNYPASGHLDIACYLLGVGMILAMAKIIIPGNLPEIPWFVISAIGIWGYPAVLPLWKLYIKAEEY